MQIRHIPTIFSGLKTPSTFPGVYQIASPFQLDCNGTVGFSLNIRRVLPGVNDIEIGSDLAILDSPTQDSINDFTVLSRSNVIIPSGQSSPFIALSFPVVCGFIPLGRHLSDGRPHPHAGTGFGFSHIIALPCTSDGRLEGPQLIHERMKDSITFVELFQFAYDGQRFTIKNRELLPADGMIPGWRFVSCPLGECIEDENRGLLSGLVASEAGTASLGRSGVVRWSYSNDGWHPLSFTPVSPEGTREPSLIRDTDGSLLFTTRGADESQPTERCPDGVHRHDLRLWRSVDDGLNWILICHERFKCASTPICLGMTLDGTPLLTGNPLRLPPDVPPTHYTGNMRSTLVMWPFSKARDRVTDEICLLDSEAVFGPPPYGSSWWIDHPKPSIVTFKDGIRHSIITARVLEYEEVLGKKPVTTFTGTHLFDLLSR